MFDYVTFVYYVKQCKYSVFSAGEICQCLKG